MFKDLKKLLGKRKEKKKEGSEWGRRGQLDTLLGIHGIAVVRIVCTRALRRRVRMRTHE